MSIFLGDRNAEPRAVQYCTQSEAVHGYPWTIQPSVPCKSPIREHGTQENQIAAIPDALRSSYIPFELLPVIRRTCGVRTSWHPDRFLPVRRTLWHGVSVRSTVSASQHRRLHGPLKGGRPDSRNTENAGSCSAFRVPIDQAGWQSTRAIRSFWFGRPRTTVAITFARG